MAQEETKTTGTKKKKKWPWFVGGGCCLIIVIIIIVMVVGVGGAVNEATKNDTKKTNGNSTDTNTSQPAKTETKKFNIDDIYAQINTGMTEAEVKVIITKDPINCTESTNQYFGTSKFCTYGNVFLNSGTIMVTYTNGKVDSKTKSQY